MNRQQLMQTRIGLLQVFLRRNNYDGILLSRIDNFAMATGGLRNYVPTATDMGASSLFITKDGRACFVGNNIERTRVEPEEFGDTPCGFRDFPWFEGSPAAVVRKEFGGALVSDDGSLGENVNGKLAYLRALLTPEEIEKYRRLGSLAADAITATALSVRAGQTEADIAAALVAEGAKRRCTMSVVLVAADDRILRYRHPLAVQARLLEDGLTEVPVQRYVMIVGGFLREGLVVSVTRFARVADVSPDLCSMHTRICGVDALLHEASRPGRTLGEVFIDCQQAYADLGFLPHEWHNHHQGGTTGYAGRTCKAAPGEAFPILDSSWADDLKTLTGIDTAFGHAFAWNPSAPGVKSEDTFVLLPDGTKEIVTRTPAFPEIDLAGVLGRDLGVGKPGMLDVSSR